MKKYITLTPTHKHVLNRDGKICIPISFHFARVLTLHLLMLCGSLICYTQLVHANYVLTCPAQASPNPDSSNPAVDGINCDASSMLNHLHTLL